ncbi:MAG: paraquat-inducible protein A [Gemmatimonadales bacterium]
MTKRNYVAIALTIVSLALLWPGLTRPVLTITASVTALGTTREIFRQTQSITEAVRSLHESGNDFVAGLVLLFSIMVPVIKAALLLALFALRSPVGRYRLFSFLRSVSKWSMADVFAVGTFIAYLAAKATDNLDAVAGEGFYYFAGYCLVSNLAFQFLSVPLPERTTPA